MEVSHPAHQRSLHELPGGRDVLPLAGDGVVALDLFRIAEQRGAEAVAEVVVVAATSVMRVGVRLGF